MLRTLIASVSMVIFGGKWLSQMWIFKVPVPDLLFWTGIFISILKVISERKSIPISEKGKSHFFWINLFSFIFIVMFLRVAYSITYPNTEIDGIFYILRDAAPFLALGSIGFLTRAFIKIDETQFKRSFRIFQFASVGAAFSSIASFMISNGEGFTILTGIFTSPILQIRSDQICYALIPFYFLILNKFCTSKNYKIIFILIFFIVLFLVPLRLTSRSSFITTSFALVMCSIYLRKYFKPLYFHIVTFSFLTIIAIGVFFLSFKSNAIQKLMAGFGLSNLDNNSDIIELAGKNTQNARVNAWKIVWNSLKEHLLLGFPPGDNYIYRSGASYYLSGSELVRAPHNFFLNCFARYGIALGALLIYLIFRVLIISIQNSWNSDATVNDWLSCTILIGISIVSSMGVVLESPFGYIPFVFSSAYVLHRRRKIISI